ncbi:UDP-Glycosyltransferase/glycogen phosphorylase [Pseudovirgaria hyperparasitica]|uniref:UDP-Glycosyltransferase/glycogen phosphorylase n=1 Tax=Pseudovirgaria hyperparasitica TaxID=470096 RepID=A0A6A6W568_9PEZI|nr:UDP-Glycosyltransferase/glycogen phosphorylase [Pseudovirgaria hyperparasitica]KAF2757695.1 UDP-Glycosyltransferase/glycogen phosphorylase [Pseudovirgaria hyperparasitica]
METVPDNHEHEELLRRTRSDRPPIIKSLSVTGGRRRPAFNGSQRPHSPPGLTRAITYRFDDYSEDEGDSSSDEAVVDHGEHVDAAERPREHHTKKQKTRRPSSSDPYSRFSVGNDNFKTKGRVSRRDGRLKISIKEHATTGYLAKTLNAGIKRTLRQSQAHKPSLAAVAEKAAGSAIIPGFHMDDRPIPNLNIVIMVIGSRGDIQPFIKIGKILKEEHGHRVRIATHPTFKKFVEKDSGLEFFNVGGDPSELMAFMVKNPGLIPSVETVRQGEIGRRRAAMSEMFDGFWRACINATDDETDMANLKMMGNKRAFVADAIIANPPSFAHVHIAERLGIPLHMMFTFPYTPTTQFPHPLANIKSSNVDPSYGNFISYPLVDMMTWQGLGDLVNKFRKHTLGMEPVSTLWAPGQLYRLKVPYTYMWSPGLVPKPSDWGPEIDIAGFVFLELASSFKPSKELSDFMKAGPPPVYIGFGSIVVDDPEAFTKMILDAVKIAGVRALVSKGWGGLGGNDTAPDNVFFLGNTPHDWLFPQVQAVIHHGGAGTTAMGLKCGRPTMIVPFFGDQPFWGAMVAEKKAGAHECIPFKSLTTELFAKGIKECLTDEAKENAQVIAHSIEAEGDGAANAVKAFHHNLPMQGSHSMRCSLLEERVAVWHMKGTKLRLSSLAADVLVDRKKLKWSQLRLIRHKDWNDFGGPGEPLTGGGTALVRTTASAAKGVIEVPVNMVRSIKRREKHAEKKKKLRQRQEKELEKVSSDGLADAKIVSSHPETDAHQPSADQLTRQDTDPMLDRARRPKVERNDTNLSKISADPSENFVEENVHHTLHSAGKVGSAILKAPMELSLAVAQGFHNAPRLYGDETVRRPIRVSGFYSGLRAGRDEFVYGIYDAFTGLYTHPRDGVKREGALGLVKGVGTGVGGLVLKHLAAVIGPGAYAAKGVHMEFRKRHQPTGFIRRARILQGRDDIDGIDKGDEDDVVDTVLRGWSIVSDVIELQNKQHEREEKKHHGTVSSLFDKSHLNVKHLGENYRQRRTVGKLQSVAVAERTLQAQKHGMSLEEFEKKKVQNPEGEKESKSEDTGGWRGRFNRESRRNQKDSNERSSSKASKIVNSKDASRTHSEPIALQSNGLLVAEDNNLGETISSKPMNGTTQCADFATIDKGLGKENERVAVA